jgi:hypothetical protein
MSQRHGARSIRRWLATGLPDRRTIGVAGMPKAVDLIERPREIQPSRLGYDCSSLTAACPEVIRRPNPRPGADQVAGFFYASHQRDPIGFAPTTNISTADGGRTRGSS